MLIPCMVFRKFRALSMGSRVGLMHVDVEPKANARRIRECQISCKLFVVVLVRISGCYNGAMVRESLVP